MKLLYNTFIQSYILAARVLSLYNPKAKLWLNGRKDIFNDLQTAFANNTSPVIWMHCASLGEFEQGRTIIERLKAENIKIAGTDSQRAQPKFLITFFSPSGYEVQKNYEQADWVFYLPVDTAANAKRFFDIVQPSLVLFVKYEFWYHYLQQAKQRNIPLLLVSGIFRSSQPFFKWYGGLHREMLYCFTYFFVQNNEAELLLKSVHKKNNVAVCGDTRFDRVIEIAGHVKSYPAIENFIGNSRVIVAGSTWTEDDEELDHYANTHPEIKFIIAPHDIGIDRLQECLTLYKNSVLFSAIETATANTNVVIIDNIGMLSKLYRYASICLVGGGFGGDGVHNVLEAAVYGKPVIFGPVYDKYVEAVELVNCNGAMVVEDALELEEVLNEILSDENLLMSISNNAKQYVLGNAGATNKVVKYISNL